MVLARGRARPDLDERLHRSRLKKYLLADETPILAQHQHWAALLRPIAIGVGGLFVLAGLALFLPASLDGLNPFLLLAWFVLFGGWALWKWYEWKRKWLVATDKRLLVNYGLIRQGVSMISLSRIVDLTYTRTTLGQLLGYGTLERESQKYPGSLHEVRWVKNPDSTYLTVCAAIFNLQDRMFGMQEIEHDHRLDDVPPPHTPGLYAGYVPPEERTGPRDFHDAPDQGDEPSIRVQYGVSHQIDRDPWHQSANLRESSIRDADTGPIPTRRSATDESDDWLPTTNHKYPDQNPDHDR
jgi:Bacterial PH domain